jgi:hypothetical protein
VKKYLTITLAILMIFCGSIRTAAASIYDSRIHSAFKDKGNVETAAYLENSFPSASYKSDAAIEDVAREPNPQATPTGGQNPSTHHSHRLRNAIIIITLGAALLIGLAAAAK